ncbi:MAG: hypothetical protein FJ091_09700 [Deltaproteobacteria bacterium]|nr:hypothetical protein [Deltaproteobacteria bacterium]
MAKHGFAEVECNLRRSDSPLDGRELQFESWGAEYVDTVHLWFDKYDSPRFQIAFNRRLISDQDQIVRGGRLVRRASEYYHEWGKPRWQPLLLWTERRARSQVDVVVRRTPQIVEFLETGARGPNVNREVRVEAAGHAGSVALTE